jgi:hypothetical protein
MAITHTRRRFVTNDEAGFTKAVPQTVIAEHTDWRFLNELKRELKA